MWNVQPPVPVPARLFPPSVAEHFTAVAFVSTPFVRSTVRPPTWNVFPCVGLPVARTATDAPRGAGFGVGGGGGGGGGWSIAYVQTPPSGASSSIGLFGSE